MEFFLCMMENSKWGKEVSIIYPKRNIKTSAVSQPANYKKISSLGDQNLKTTGYKISGYMIQV